MSVIPIYKAGKNGLFTYIQPYHIKKYLEDGYTIIREIGAQEEVVAEPSRGILVDDIDFEPYFYHTGGEKL